jgi:hypothetical protein
LKNVRFIGRAGARKRRRVNNRNVEAKNEQQERARLRAFRVGLHITAIGRGTGESEKIIHKKLRFSNEKIRPDTTRRRAACFKRKRAAAETAARSALSISTR